MPVVKKSLSTQIFETLRQDILDQKIAFGEKIVNRDLQTRFGVSSSPVRDAINLLYREGLLQEITNSGARVIVFDFTQAREISEIVYMLNREAIRLSAQKSDTAAVVARLVRCVEMQQKNIGQAQYFYYDTQYHQTFVDFCQNEKFKDLYAQYHTLWELLVRCYTQSSAYDTVRCIRQHSLVIDAYKQKNIPLAQTCMEKHFLEALDYFEKALK